MLMRISKGQDLNQDETRRDAEKALDIIIPGIRTNLLSGPDARRSYDQRLKGLDKPLEVEFRFDEKDEEPAGTIREIAIKLDKNWAFSRTWLMNTSLETHELVRYMRYAAERPSLAEHIERIIQAITPASSPHNAVERPSFAPYIMSEKNNQTGTSYSSSQMDVNEALERCITLLNPWINQPCVAVYYQGIEGRAFNLGNLIAESNIPVELILRHVSQRGCAFGSIESQTNWVKFGNNERSMRFALMPEGTRENIGVAEMKVNLLLDIRSLARYNDYSAELFVQMENQKPQDRFSVIIRFYLSPLPPRVSFESMFGSQEKIPVDTVLKGDMVSITVIPQNAGDEDLIPLDARISTHDIHAAILPQYVRANQPIELMVDTSKRLSGERYTVAFNIDYSSTPGAEGITTLVVEGNLFPTPWQSFASAESFELRIQSGFATLLKGGILFLFVGGILFWLLANASGLLFVTFPLLFMSLALTLMTTFGVHMKHAGKHIPGWANTISVLLASGVGFLVAFLGNRVSASVSTSPFFVTLFVVLIVFFISGFISDQE